MQNHAKNDLSKVIDPLKELPFQNCVYFSRNLLTDARRDWIKNKIELFGGVFQNFLDYQVTHVIEDRHLPTQLPLEKMPSKVSHSYKQSNTGTSTTIDSVLMAPACAPKKPDNVVAPHLLTRGIAMQQLSATKRKSDMNINEESKNFINNAIKVNLRDFIKTIRTLSRLLFIS